MKTCQHCLNVLDADEADYEVKAGNWLNVKEIWNATCSRDERLDAVALVLDTDKYMWNRVECERYLVESTSGKKIWVDRSFFSKEPPR